MFAISLTPLYSHCQNLVPNPGFEAFADSFATPGYIDTTRVNPKSCPDWWTASWIWGKHWKNFDGYTNNLWPVHPRTGDNFASAFINTLPFRDWRTFLQTRLISPLEADCTYEITFYVRPHTQEMRSPYSNFPKGMGAFVSKDRINEYPSHETLVLHNPQVVHDTYLTDTTDYTMINGKMIAQGGEEYLTIGFFVPDDSITGKKLDGSVVVGECFFYYLIDDVEVRKVPANPHYADLLPDEASIAPGDTLTLRTGVPGTIWSTGVVGEEIEVFEPGEYEYTIEDRCFSYTDVISVVSKEVVVHIPNAFTPNGDGLNEKLEIGVYGVTKYRASIYDRWGKIVFEYNSGPGKFSWDGKFNGREAPSGVYMLRIDTEGKHGAKSFSEMINLLR